MQLFGKPNCIYISNTEIYHILDRKHHAVSGEYRGLCGISGSFNKIVAGASDLINVCEECHKEYPRAGGEC